MNLINSNNVSSVFSGVINFETIMLYLATDDEVSCDETIIQLLKNNKTVLIPYGEGGIYEAVQLNHRDEVTIGRRGIRTIVGKEIRSGPIDCIVCPGRLFTIDGRRTGRGSGRYDRFLAKHPESHKIGLSYSDHIVDHIDQQPWDVAMDEMVVV